MVLREIPAPRLAGLAPVSAESASGASATATGRATGEARTAATATPADEPLDVCLLSYRSDPYSGGQGVYVKYLSRALTRLGHHVTVVSGQPYPEVDPGVDLVELPGENVVDAEDRLRAFDLEYLRNPVKLFEWTSVLTGGFPDPYTFGRRAVEFLEDRGDDFDVVHDNQSLSYGLLDLLERDVPTVATVHHPITADREIALEHADGLTESLFVRRWYRFLRMQKRVAQQLPHVISVSAATRDRTVQDFGVDPASISVVHNGIDTDLFRPRPDVAERSNRIMTTVSADVPLKGARYLLEAFASLTASRPDAELVIVGEFTDGGTAATMTEELGIADAITTHTEISYERMVELYASAAIAVVPSLYEGFGLPAAEAMACGVPTVATTGGALPEIVGDSGRLVPPGDADALATAMAALLESPAIRQRLGERARDRITSTFDWERTATETVATYRQAIDAHR
jgi:glycosyltransferase involved in cell wall biosynthesis